MNDPAIPQPSPFAQALATIAVQELQTYQGQEEDTDCVTGKPCLAKQIATYWNELHSKFSEVPGFQNVGVAWSAVFVSWCVMKAKTPPVAFLFSDEHSEFVHDAINNPRAFKGRRLDAYAPRVGDIVANNRPGSNHDFDYAAANSNYPSHSRIVVSKGQDSNGKFVQLVGGNENQTGNGGIHQTRFSLNADGTLVQVAHEPFIAVLQNLV